MSTDWDELLGAALVGTARRGFTVDRLGIPGADGVAAEGAEAQLLAAAALASGYRRAGWVPPVWRGTPAPPAGPDDRPECSPAAAQLLELLLNRTIRIEGGTDLIVLHWLAAARAAGQRPPHPMVVDLLRFGTANTATRAVIRDVLGPRGAWLARFNPAWRWAATVPPEDVVERFATATRADRLALLADLRATEPDFARTLVEDTWDDEQAATRAGLLDTFHIGLSERDEPLLERALDDRAASVRAAAAAMLDRLPGSARAARMAARATALITVGKGLTVELPDEPDAAARRDGVTDHREPGYGRAASWLIQILAATPLSTWDPDLIGDADQEVLTGWTKAALRQRNQEWLAALARHQPGPELIGALTPEVATEILAGQKKLDARFGGLLAAARGPWPAEFSAALINRMRAQKTENVLQLAASALAEHLHPAALAAVEGWLLTLDAERKPARRVLRGLAHALTVRATIDQEFR
ncbi:DUF5691 domain-containing protein [Actinophytocola algeriensis]|uniref:Uncharacterized protein n=1 Tax=Actinophytocola algeriensis TaxID=1768010 RepID=A0A7W7Q6G5_9PSEU|nr:DUF5691 domain-containing protein [Actinophytocola algeriensis]MBB4907915.1 hypothetical protein [Actinophytocola algeriensis]MBE1479945.1 hypothetical protein [Actinophytocola algeriensis]